MNVHNVGTKTSFLFEKISLWSLFLLSTGSQKAEDFHPKGPGKEYWSNPGAQRVSGAVRVSLRPVSYAIYFEFVYIWIHYVAGLYLEIGFDVCAYRFVGDQEAWHELSELYINEHEYITFLFLT